jgi:hypothetical protein
MLKNICHQKNELSLLGTGIPGSIGCKIIKNFSIGVELELQGIALQRCKIGIDILTSILTSIAYVAYAFMGVGESLSKMLM